jgi:hypothetical protein
VWNRPIGGIFNEKETALVWFCLFCLLFCLLFNGLIVIRYCDTFVDELYMVHGGIAVGFTRRAESW